MILSRIEAGTLHTTGPMWGSGEPVVRHEAAALEEAVLAEHAELAQGLAATRLDQDRRALRVMPAALTWQLDGDCLTLRFRLPKGAFATSVLAELMTIKDAMIEKGGAS